MMKMAVILKSKMAAKREMTSKFCKCFNFNLWYHKHRYCHHFEVILWFKKMKYRPKHAENGGHFKIQDGRHGDKLKKWQQFDLNSWVPSPSFKTKKSNCSRTSHKYQFRHISNQTIDSMWQHRLARPLHVPGIQANRTPWGPVDAH